MPLCCRELPEPEESDQAISNQTLTSLSGRFGDLRNCDMPMETIKSLVDDAFNLTENVNYPDQIIVIIYSKPSRVTSF